ncbi:hypothetical protein TWF506_000084 [Arthrobotrys conoides]|uniref:F-box domain-containing protein n=1 Tax=Arthrobotrys conoides TaxID=74498 RepID=A0AAN8NKU7_9PEZI
MEAGFRKLNSGKLQVLPTELLLSVFEYLDIRDKRAFSKCSRACYFLTFRARIRGIQWQTRYDCTPPSLLKRFEDGQCFAPLNGYIKSAKFDFETIENLSTRLAVLSKFPAITSIKIRLVETRDLERNLYVRILSILATLPYYDNITYLGFEWMGDEMKKECMSSFEGEYVDDNDPHELDSGTAVDQTYRIQDNRADTIKKIHSSEWIRRAFEWKKVALREEKFLGKCVSRIGVNQLALRGDIRLPKGLQSLKLGMSECEPSFCLPLLRCEAITTLCLGVPTWETISTSIYPELNTMLEFPRIKDLTLYFCSSNFFYYEELLKKLPHQFPNITSLTSRGTRYIGVYLVPLPDFPKLESLDVDIKRLWDIDTAEGPLKDRLQVGGFPKLKTFKYTAFEGNLEAQLICSISRFKSSDGGEETYDFHWEELRNGHLSVMARKVLNSPENEETEAEVAKEDSEDEVEEGTVEGQL